MIVRWWDGDETRKFCASVRAFSKGETTVTPLRGRDLIGALRSACECARACTGHDDDD